MLNFIFKSPSILKKFLLINLVIFTVIGLFTIIYLLSIEPSLIKNKSANHIIKAYVYGESSKQITRQIKPKIKVSVFENLDQVIKTIFQEINNYTSKTTILFAPACTSYDQYKNFEERGIHFSKLILI